MRATRLHQPTPTFARPRQRPPRTKWRLRLQGRNSLTRLGLVFGALVVFIAGRPVQADIHGIWTDKFEEAKTRARREGKDLLINFTGSDWCTWCTKLEKQVFDTSVYAKEASRYFVHVRLDYPRDKSLVCAVVRKQNEKLKDFYKPKGYPTILLTDASGRPYARTGYRSGGPELYLKHVIELRNNRVRTDTAANDT